MSEETASLIGSLGDAVPIRGPHLLVVAPSAPGRRVAITGDLVIGRGDAATLRIEDPAISRAHARLERRAGRTLLVDLGSHNGVSVNGARITAARALGSGDLVALGRTTLVYYDDPPAPVADVDELPPLPALPHRTGPSVVADPAMRALYVRVHALASQPITVVVTGETGTGKEVIARALHAWSPRAARPFIALNCAAVPDALAESELFGHERGAFSGATTARPGVLEAADGGTLLLDEIGELSLANQARLLRALDARRVVRVGSTRERIVDFRLIAATNADLEAEVAGGRFRPDLFYRLGGATLVVPPLRAPRADKAALATTFLADAAASHDRPARTLAADALAVLEGYAWPGNVRELAHAIAALAVGNGEIRASELPARFATVQPAARGALDDELRTLERRRIEDALAATGGNQTRAAQQLGMPRRTFVAKLRTYKLR